MSSIISARSVRLSQGGTILAALLAIVSLIALGFGAPSASAGATAGTVSGLVTDGISGSPLAGAIVTVSTGYWSVEDTTYSTTTQADGSYLVSDVNFGGSFPIVRVDLGGYGTRNATFEGLSAESPDRVVNVDLPPIDAEILGVISDAGTGAPIEGASLRFYSLYDSGAAISGTDGTYSAALTAGSYAIFLSAPNYLDARLDNVAVSSEESLTVDWSLIPSDAEISGRVTDAGTGAGIPGIGISIRSDDSSNLQFSGSSDIDGYYTVLNLGLGSWSIELGSVRGGPDSNGAYWVYAARTVLLAGGEASVQDFNMELLELGAISGSVLDENGLGLGGMCVAVLEPATGDTIAYGMTESDGTYLIETVPVGTNTIFVQHCRIGNYAATYLGDGFNRADAETFTLATEGDSLSGLDIHTTLGGSISGSSQVSTPDGAAPLPGTRIATVRPTMYQNVGGDWEQIPYDSPYFGDDSGNYVLNGLPPVDICVVFLDNSTGVGAFAPSYYRDGTDCDSADLVSVTPGGTVTGIDALLKILRPGYDPTPSDTLAPSAEGDIDSDAVITQGDTTVIDIGQEHAGEWVSVFGHSTPTAFGTWYQVSSAGTVTATVPFGLVAGAHSLVAQSATDVVLGWNPVTVLAGTIPAGPPAGSPSGGNSSSAASSGSGTHHWTLAEISAKFGGDTVLLLAKYLADTGKIFPPLLSEIIANPDDASLDLSDFSAWLTWSHGDTTVSLWGYSSATYLGTFPVVDGHIIATNLDLTKAGEGEHHILIVGEQSGSYGVGTYSVDPPTVTSEEVVDVEPIKLAPAVDETSPVLPWIIGGGVILLLIVGGFIIFRRRSQVG